MVPLEFRLLGGSTLAQARTSKQSITLAQLVCDPESDGGGRTI